MKADNHRVLIYRNELLAYSETFIKEQALALRIWHPVLVGERFVRDGLDLGGLDTALLLPANASKMRLAMYKAFRFFSIPDPWVLKRLRSLHASLIHVHFGTCAVDIWPYVKKLSLPMFITLHGYDVTTYKKWWNDGHGGWRNRNYPQKLIHLSQNNSVHFIAVSQDIKEKAIEYGIDKNKITVSYIGVDTKKFIPIGNPIIERRNRLIFVGRLVEKKGVAYLIDAFAQIKKKIPDVELVIVGDGPLKHQLRKMTQELHVDKVFFKGVLNSEQVREEMAKARLLCVPSITAENGNIEGLPTVLLEAQASGLPVIASTVGGMKEGVVEGVTGFLIPEKNVEILKNKILYILNNRNELQYMSDNSIEFIREKFDLRENSKKLEEIYKQYLN